MYRKFFLILNFLGASSVIVPIAPECSISLRMVPYVDLSHLTLLSAAPEVGLQLRSFAVRKIRVQL